MALIVMTPRTATPLQVGAAKLELPAKMEFVPRMLASDNPIWMRFAFLIVLGASNFEVRQPASHANAHL
jgi:hypothetical protein